MTHVLIAEEILGGKEPMPVESERCQGFPNEPCTLEKAEQDSFVGCACEMLEDNHQAALTRWRSTLLPFEDQVKIFNRLYNTYAILPEIWEPKPGTILSLDIENEVVEQVLLRGAWMDIHPDLVRADGGKSFQFEYRKVLRIK